nr:hypothetical protein [uncultured Halomonas sp.]
MKTVAETRVLDVEGAIVRVAWRFARRERGIFVIDLTHEEGLQRHEFPVVAELITLHAMLYPDPMAGRANRFALTTLILLVSQAEVVAITSKQSSMVRAFVYATPFRTHLRDIEMHHACGVMDAPWDADFPESGPIEEIPLMVTPRLRAGAFIQHIAGFGPVGITEHAIDRVSEMEGGTPRSMLSIIKQLSHPAMIEVALPFEVVKHKLFKYNDVRFLECWRHPEGNTLFIMLKGELSRTLVTVTRLPKERLREHIPVATKPASPCDYAQMMTL